MSTLLSEPRKKRMICGMSRPINPIMPPSDTDAAVINPTETKSMILSLCGAKPRLWASSSPRMSAFNAFARDEDSTIPATTNASP